MLKTNEMPLTFKKGKIPRNELELPTLHFVVMDQWVDVIGERALFAWLRMYTWCKRDGEEIEDVDFWEQARIPMSLNKVMKKLSVGRGTFYNQILKPLWNVGLIDIEEYSTSSNKGNKPMNIIVYKYPQNNKSLAHKEITMIRNYDDDYSSDARKFAKKGGRPKSEDVSSDNDIQGENKNIEGGSVSELGVVPDKNHPPFHNKTRGGSKIEPINSLNTNNNSLNTNNNSLNNSSSSKKDKNKKENTYERNEEEDNIINLCNNFIAYKVLAEYLGTKGVENKTVSKTIYECYKRNLTLFSMEDVQKQFEFMMDKVSLGERIYDFAVFFANGLKEISELTNAGITYQNEKMKEYERIIEQKEKNGLLYYNWLES